MSSLHPLSWLFVTGCLLLVGLATTNWILLVLVIGGLVALALAEGSSTLVGIAGILGLVVFAIQLGFAMLLGTASGSVLFTIPQWRLGPGVRLGGDVDLGMLLAGTVTGLHQVIVILVVALLGGVRPARDWLDLTGLLSRRGARWFGPLLAGGEATTQLRRDTDRLRDEGLGRLGPGRSLAAVGTRSLELTDDWWAGQRSVSRTALKAGFATVMAIAAVWLFDHGSVFLGAIELLPAQVIALAVLVWGLGRWLVLGSPLPRPRWGDVVTLVAAIGGIGVLEWIRRSPEAVQLNDTAAIPGLPIAAGSAVLVLTVVTGVCAALGGSRRAHA